MCPLLPAIAALFTLQERPLPAPTATGDIALSRRRVAELRAAERFGNAGGWYPSDTRFESRAEGDVLVATAARVDPDGGCEYVRLLLRSTGARGEAFYTIDVPHEDLRDLAGVAALLTDGAEAALEFEVTCSDGVHGMKPTFGRIHLGAAGVALATALAQRESRGFAERFDQLAKNEVATAAGVLLSAGYVDSRRRRQGLWTLRDEAGRMRLESSWRDGRLTGRVTCWDEDGRRSGEEDRRDGFLDGTSYVWSEDGEPWSFQEHVAGLAHGMRIVFHPGGRKRLETSFEWGAELVGNRRRWDENGVLLEGPRVPVASRSAARPDSSWTSFQDELAAFATRRE